MEVPLVKLPFEYWNQFGCPKGKTDMILITDANLNIGDYMRKNFNEWREKEEVKVISLVLADAPGDVDKISDETHILKALSLDEKGLQSCLEV